MHITPCRPAFQLVAACVFAGLSAASAVAQQPLQERSCAGHGAASGLGAITGVVVASPTGTRLGGVHVELRDENDEVVRSIRTTSGGEFAICDAPVGGYRIEASLADLGYGEVEVNAVGGEETRIEIPLTLRVASHFGGSMQGVVIDGESEQPLPGVVIQLGANDRMTDASGRFVFSHVEPGRHTLKASRIGYGDAEGEVRVERGQAVHLEVRMTTEPITLEGILVTAVGTRERGILEDVRRRAASGWGSVLIGEEIETRQARATRVTDMLMDQRVHVAGGQLMLPRSGCAPHVYLDGVKITRRPRGGGGLLGDVGSRIEAYEAVNMLSPSMLHAVEVYRGPGEIPAEYLNSDAKCGVILIWTRRGPGTSFARASAADRGPLDTRPYSAVGETTLRFSLGYGSYFGGDFKRANGGFTFGGEVGHGVTDHVELGVGADLSSYGRDLSTVDVGQLDLSVAGRYVFDGTESNVFVGLRGGFSRQSASLGDVDQSASGHSVGPKVGWIFQLGRVPVEIEGSALHHWFGNVTVEGVEVDDTQARGLRLVLRGGVRIPLSR